MIRWLFRRWIEVEAAKMSQQRASEVREQLVETLIEASKTRLGVSSPSRVFAGLGQTTTTMTLDGEPIGKSNPRVIWKNSRMTFTVYVDQQVRGLACAEVDRAISTVVNALDTIEGRS